MANKMLIDATHPEETRVVVLRGNRVEEFDFESASRRQLRGNIYLAKVTRVEPSLQAAFVDYGGNRHGFLAFSEIHPDYYQIPVADRQALIDEEERAHRAAEVEADRRAAARAPHTAPANRSPQPDHRIASAPVPAEEDYSADEEPGHEVQASVIEAWVESTSAPAEAGEPAPHDVDRLGSEGEAGAGEPDAAVAASAEASPEPAAEAGEFPSPFSAGGAEPAGELPETAGSAVAADFALAGSLPESSAESDLDASSAEAPVTVLDGKDDDVGLAGDSDAEEEGDGEGDDDEADDDEADDDEDDDEDDDDEAAAAEETVESVGGADALEEAQERAPRIRRQYKIQEVIRRRQIMLVQVVKEERGTKGAALTTYLSLAGRYSVLMPNTARGGGISRKITSPQDRNRLKEIAHELEVPEGMGVILRTAGAMRTKTEIKRDFEYLLRMWEQVRDLTLKSSAPTLVYEEGSVVKRAIRDLYNKDIDEVIVSGEPAFREAKDFMRMLMPSHAKNVKLYGEGQPLLIRYGVESQLDAMFSPIVQLRSGGYIVLNQTEALVAIDVNSGRATREHHIEDTALKTNLEAAEEIARQLRLRDLAGLIVIDFIDMDEKRNNRAVERRLKECLKNDRARIQVGRISHFGLLEMSRQRIRTSVFESSTEKCPHCGGTGHVRSVASVALQCLRMLEEALLRGATHNIVVRTGSEVALYMLNFKRSHLRELEQRFRIIVTVKVDAAPSGQQPFLIEKAEQVHSLEQARALAAQPAALVPIVVPEDEEFGEEAEAEGEDASVTDELGEDAERVAGDNGGRRRRRRRRRGRRGDEQGEADLSGGETVAEHAIAHEDHDGGEGEDGGPAAPHALEHGAGEGEAAGDGGPGDRRRRRRGRRGGRRNRRPEGEGAPSTLGDEAVELPEQEIIEASADLEGAGLEDGSPAFEPSLGDHAYPAEQEAAPQQAETGTEEELPPILAAGHPPLVDAEPAPAPVLHEEATAAPPEAPTEAAASEPAPRRRSTVREPVILQGESNGAAAPETAPTEPSPAEAAPEANAAPFAEPPVEAAESAAQDEPVGARRTGWWARRIMGGNKG
ncbi:MAG: Rne/Rng family ribonuclease [Bradyrhizobiaceae bacterium]|nr:Rne/Rng family ribonuclease [Bradyrhizobiaceae bacterium]